MILLYWRFDFQCIKIVIILKTMILEIIFMFLDK
jgi:hypothetical protein